MKSTRFKNRKPKSSLRVVLISWFLILSLVPSLFIAGTFLSNYQIAIDTELVQRLRSNVREFSSRIVEFEKYLESRRVRHRNDAVLNTLLGTNSIERIRNHTQNVSRNTPLSRISVFNRNGDVIASLGRDEIMGKPNHDVNDFSMQEAYKDAVDKKGDLNVTDFVGKTMDLVAITKLTSKAGKTVGYIEEIISVEPRFLEGLKSRLGLEIILFDGNSQIVAGSHPDFDLFPKNLFVKAIQQESETLFDLPIRNELFGFVIAKIPWGERFFLIGIGASKKKTEAILRKFKYAFLSILLGVGILSVILSFFMARIILRPLNHLLDGIQAMDTKEGPTEIPITTSNEIGVVTESFNDMSQRVWQTKQELEKKVKELEDAYRELKETQARLVHSAKMASLGQLVAGVAHELNNPIGFIYANMTHLREYSERLIAIIEEGEQNPKEIHNLKEKYEYDYLISDMPKLIKSCEDGAQRTRDIVLGLRNFSRHEEAALKRVHLSETVENTLQMLAGEIKNRITIHKQFDPIPEVLCYASELNQVFMNLLANAAQAIEGEGEIWIRISMQEAGGRGKWARISIRDNGRGIPQSTIERIFDPFFTTKAVGKGTGLGLSISYGIVRKHGGEITVRSEVGKGTEFVVTIPIDGPV